MLKDLFADTMEDMLKAELDEELGYAKNSQQPKTTGAAAVSLVNMFV